MNANTSIEQSHEKSNITRGIIRRLIQVAITFLIQAAILFISSGRLDWVMAWVYLGVLVGLFAINALVLLQTSPELIAERAQIKADAKRWDRPLAGIISLFGPIGILLIAGLDLRFGWSPEIAWQIQVGALVFMALGYIFANWAMVSNKFFSGLVRIQKERNHTVATGGPYRYVRHPGYSGWSLAYLTTPLVLGSWWALIPAVLTMGVIIVRTALEDKTLQEELDGYKDYVQQVRYRLLPGIW
jgi:protein-S-isoprenylcysteine O-methyltransferase Ste14